MPQEVIRLSTEILEDWWRDTRCLTDHGYDLDEIIRAILDFLKGHQTCDQSLSYLDFLESHPGHSLTAVLESVLGHHDLNNMAFALERLYYRIRNTLIGYYYNRHDLTIVHDRFDIYEEKRELLLMR